jgi:hypothetical protein
MMIWCASDYINSLIVSGSPTPDGRAGQSCGHSRLDVIGTWRIFRAQEAAASRRVFLARLPDLEPSRLFCLRISKEALHWPGTTVYSRYWQITYAKRLLKFIQLHSRQFWTIAILRIFNSLPLTNFSIAVPSALLKDRHLPLQGKSLEKRKSKYVTFGSR